MEFFWGLLDQFSLSIPKDGEADWKYAAKDFAQNQWLYDTTGITHPTDNIVRVWAKTIFSIKGIDNLVKTKGKKMRCRGNLYC